MNNRSGFSLTPRTVLLLVVMAALGYFIWSLSSPKQSEPNTAPRIPPRKNLPKPLEPQEPDVENDPPEDDHRSRPQVDSNTDYSALPRPKTTFTYQNFEVDNVPSRVQHNHIMFLDEKPFKIHSEIARVDTFFFNDPDMPKVVNYAFWGDACEAHIVSDVTKSANWLSVKSFKQWKKLIRPGSVAIDIGAQQGDTMIQMAPFAGLTIAMEPHPRIFVATQTNADINPQFNIHPYNVAASATGKDYSERWCYGCNGGADDRAGSECFDAKIVNVPSFLKERYSNEVLSNVGFIKIDTEGFDDRILLTLKPLLEITNPKPIIFIEWYISHTSSDHRQRYKANIAAINYIPYALDGETEINLDTHEKLHDIILRPAE
jgi:FkbM family methyltransferase